MSLCDHLPTRTVAARKVTFPTAPVRSHPRSMVTEPRPRFVGLAWASLILGIVGVMCSAVPLLNAVTMLGAIVGLVLGGTGLFGFRKRLAAIGTVSCALAVVFTVSSPATVANQPVGPAPSMVAPRAPVEPPAALPAAPATPVSPTTAARRAVPTPPAERVKTPSERAAVATPATAPQLVTSQPVVPRPVSPQPLATQPVVPQWDYDSSAGSVYYENCDAAWTAGAAPIKSGESGYRSELD